MTSATIPAGSCIALIAHDGKKNELVEFAQLHQSALSQFALVATGTTGARIADATGLSVYRFLSGPLGGDAQIGALVATGQCAGVLFITDPLTAHPHDPDIQGLMRLCNVHKVMLATNIPTAEAVLENLLVKEGKKKGRAAAGR